MKKNKKCTPFSKIHFYDAKIICYEIIQKIKKKDLFLKLVQNKSLLSHCLPSSEFKK